MVVRWGTMEQKFFLGLNSSGFYKIAYTQFGSNEAKFTIICVHGLTRNSRDFDFLAEHLSAKARVICPDLPGRGKSEWFTDLKHYNQTQYLTDLTALIASLNTHNIIWIGTSLGGILGLYLATQLYTPIKALILNDVGVYIPATGLQAIANYTKNNRITFVDLKEAESYMRTTYKAFGSLTDAQWQHLTYHGVTKQDNNLFKLAYDPRITDTLHNNKIEDINLWPLWEHIKCPVLVLRGEKSCILSKETTDQMSKVNSKATIVELPECGHPPMLMSIEQINIISDWLYANAIY